MSNLGDKTGAAAPQSLEELMAQAYAMELEAVERYTELADALEMHNNHEVAALFRTMAGYEAKHAQQILTEMGWQQPPRAVRAPSVGKSFEGAETVPSDEVHYLMQPWHALQLALAAEQRAEAFFASLASVATSDAVRRAAQEMQAEEAEHVALIRQWMAKVAHPDEGWEVAPAPPRYTD